MRASRARVGLTSGAIEDMYQIMAIANYEDRFVIPTAHRELDEDAYDLRGSCGFSFGNGCSGGTHRDQSVRHAEARQDPDGGRVMAKTLQGAVGAADLSDRGTAAGVPAKSAKCSKPRQRSPPACAPSCTRCSTELAIGDLYDLQERYVLLFDRTRSLSLHLFEHVHGESRDRGQAMIDLKSMYEQHDLFDRARRSCRTSCRCSWSFCPFCRRPRHCDLLGQPAHILAALAERLRKRQSAYEAVFRALVALAAAKPKDEAVSALLERARSGRQRSRRARRGLGG